MTEWQAFYRLEPFGWRANLFGSGTVAAMLMNISRGWRGRRFMARDFLPEIEPEPKPKAMTDSRAIYRAFRDIAGRLKGKGTKR